MKIALVPSLNFGIARNGIRPQPYIPLGLLTVASIAETLGHQVEIVDINRLPAEHKIRSGKNFLIEAADFVKSRSPDFVGFTSLCYSFPQTLRLAERVSSGALVVLGGPQATAVDEAVVREFPFITAVVRGEAERSFASLLEWVEGKRVINQIGGITYRSGGQVARNSDNPLIMDLDMLPLPAYHLYPIKEFSSLPIEAGRGCPYDCTFCSTNLYFNRRFRVKSPRRLIEEMRKLRNETGCSFFELVHDMFTVDRRKVVEFCKAMLESDLPVSWRVSARVDRMDKELLALMCQAGCHEMFFGIESGSAEIQKSIHKNLDVGEIVPMLAYAQHVGIKPTASFIVGFPDETLENIRETKNMAVELVKRGVKDVQFHMLVPLPGSPLGKTFENQFVFDEALAKMPGPMWQASDWDLIRRYPAIFASFYSFPLQHVTPLQLREAYLGMAFTVKGLALFFRLWRAPLNLIRRILLHKRTPSEFQT